MTKLLRSLRASGRKALWLAASVALFLPVGCSRKADEPGMGAPDEKPRTLAVKYVVPRGWQKTEESADGQRRAAFAVPKTGDDKEDAEVLVLFFGTGSEGERDKVWDQWFSELDGDPKTTATRASFESNGATVDTFEATGKYKLNIGPQRHGMKRSPVQMVKDDFRMIGAVVHTKDRGNWFFRLVGPNGTVRAAKADFLGFVGSVE